MSDVASRRIPPLAGLCDHADAARIGPGVDESVRRLLRFHWIEKRLSDAAVARLPGTPEWEVKGALALHQWLDAEHAEALRRRIAEMRHPAPRTDVLPDAALEAWLAEVAAAPDTVTLVTGLHDVARTALAGAYRRYLAESNPLVDQPTRRVLLAALVEHEEMLDWGHAARAALADGGEAEQRAAAWSRHLHAYLAAAGGVAGGDVATPPPELPAPRAPSFRPELHPRRDARFHGTYNFEFPPQLLYNLERIPADERNLALLCKRLLEMDVPEMMASFLVEQRDMPWRHQLAYRRQLWDEARHSMMGETAFMARGVDWTRIPLNIGFALRLGQHADPGERALMLFAIEQSLMPADIGKRAEYETAVEAGDALSAHFQDFDWADEVLHTQIGRGWLKEAGLYGAGWRETAQAIHERTWAALDAYRDRQPQDPTWWRDLVRDVLGKESAVTDAELRMPEVLAE